MQIPVLETMKQFNELIEREAKANKFLENPNIITKEKEKWIAEYRLILNNLDGILHKLEELGYEVTQEEATEGFRQVKFLKL
jgi:hypothetical protein